MTAPYDRTSSLKRVMCFGDSLTWGWVPIAEGAPTTRYEPHQRWTGRLQTELGAGYVVIEEGLSGRTTTADDPTDPRLNGSSYLPSALASQFPLDLVVLMLGTNDTKTYFNRSAFDITTGISTLLGQIRASSGGAGTVYTAPQVLLIAPPPLGVIQHPHYLSMFEGAHEKTQQFSELYANLADFMKVFFLDAGAVISTDGIDGIHLTEENNQQLSCAVAETIRSVFSTTR